MLALILAAVSSIGPQPQEPVDQIPDNFRRENLVAWCIVPFDAKQRDAHQRAAMLVDLGLKRAAYDWCAHHVPYFEDEIEEYRRHGIEYFAFWGQHDSATKLFAKHALRPQTWMMLGHVEGQTQGEKVANAVEILRPHAEETAAIGCELGIYNHGGWAGEPANMAAICESLRAAGHSHVGIVYNLHHGHGHMEGFGEVLDLMKPYLLCLNLNGMVDLESPKYKPRAAHYKIMPIGTGDHERELIQTIIDREYEGPIGVLGHVASRDVADVLRENVEGLEWILRGGPRPSWIDTFRPPARNRPIVPLGEGNNALDVRLGFLQVAMQSHQVEKNFSVECRARLFSSDDFNILVAKNPKSSGTHWELYSYAHSGALSFYLPGYRPSEIKSTTPITDRQWHDLGVQFDGERVRLFVDGESVVEQPVERHDSLEAVQGPLTIGSLYSQQFGCDGQIDFLEVRSTESDSELVGHWSFDKVRDANQIRDQSTFNQPTSFVQTDLGEDYLAKWTPKSRQDSRFPYENETEADWVDDRLPLMDCGPFLCQSISVAGRGVIPKAIAIKSQRKDGAHLVLDSETLHVVAAWSGEFIDFPSARFGILKTPSVAGSVGFSGPRDVAWDCEGSEDRSLASIRVQGMSTSLTYDVDGVIVNETPRAAMVDGVCVVKRVFSLAQNSKRIFVPLFEFPSGGSATVSRSPMKDGGLRCHLESPETVAMIETSSDVVLREKHAWLAIDPGRDKVTASFAVVPARSASTLMKVFGPSPDGGSSVSGAFEHRESTNGTRWGDALVTRGVRSEEDVAFVVDTITVPFENRFKALMFTSGFDFLPDGRAYVCTVHGDVWLVSGIDDDLDEVHWQRVATGLYQPLGLKILEADDGTLEVLVLGRDRISQLIDEDGDGEIDVYKTYCDGLDVIGENHAYAMCLEADGEGNLYFLKSGSSPPHGGTLLKVDRRTRKLSVMATGYRHPNGLGVSPGGMVTSADNEGNWIPATRLDAVRQGGFYGHMPTHWREEAPSIYDPPMMWMPRSIDNSAGGQVWVDHPHWGELEGAMIHLSFGRCTANVVLPQELSNGEYQAAIYKMDLPPFLSGSMRGRFNSIDHHLYVCGLDGWQTAAVADGCFQRVRATGKAFCWPKAYKVHGNRIDIAFTQPLDSESVHAVENWQIEQWNYRWTKDYGSDHYSVSNPNRIGHDVVELKGVRYSSDDRVVTLEFDELSPVMQFNVRAQLVSADGEPVEFDLYSTIH